jgi:lipopolysaccharide/colanic/teichoic acid biosynthesis glycosyltransferase
LLLPIEDPVVLSTAALMVGEFVALVGLVLGALISDPGETGTSHGFALAKRSLDIAGALVLLIVTLPILVIAAIAVRFDSPGPAFFRQERIGKGGQPFWMVKLRTMRTEHDSSVYREHLARLKASVDDESEYTIRIDDDPRITRVGSKLRAWSIDELPNLWNVLKGSMSLVGPRPLVFEEADLIGLDNPRFTVKPGLTGLAQVQGRDSISAAERSKWDEKYVETQSVRVDLRILIATVGTVFAEPGSTGDDDRHDPSREE